MEYFSSYLIFSISLVDMAQQNLNTWNLECALNLPDKVRQENHVYSQDQGPRKIDNWGGTYSYIRVVHH